MTRFLLAACLVLCWCTLAGAAPRDSRAVNLLFAYKAQLNETRDQLEAAREPVLPAPAPCTVRTGSRWWAVDDAGSRVKLAPDVELILVERSQERRKTGFFRKSHGWITTTPEGEDLWLPELKQMGAAISTAREACSRRRIEDSLSVLRETGMLRFRLEQSARELASINEWTSRYRRDDGPHQQIDPVALLRGQAAPGSEDIGTHLPLAWTDSLPISDTPWGHAVPAPVGMSVLYFTDCDEEVWTLQDDTGRHLYMMPSRDRGDAYPLLSRFARELAERRLAARKYRLLQKWDLKVVDRVLQGLAWQGMSEAMLLESLGEPSGKLELGDGTLWRFALGNEILLRDGKVSSIRTRE